MNKDYLFTSARLGFRNWKESDIAPFSKVNADKAVMEHFPKTLSTAETKQFVERQIAHFETYGYNYFAVEERATKTFIGFIGLAFQNFESPYTPATDIGWRLNPNAWGKGFATEGAQRCLQYAFEILQLEKVIAICPTTNHNSERVIQKIGMKKAGNFNHPNLKEYPVLEECVCYEISKV